jgi:polysaccharide biosynthesis transport protein
MTELMRDYSTIQEQYTALLRKSEESKIAVNLERRQIGEQFRVIEGARLPERPISPDRLALNLMGLAVGLGFGIALAALLAYRDTTFKTDDDVVLSLALPVVAVIPAMITTAERRRMKRRRVVLALSASVASVLLVAAVIAWRLQMLQSWVR